MGTRIIIARCNRCEEKAGMYKAEFAIVFEWLSKEELIKHIQNTVCPECGSDDWYLTDASEI